jgi:nitrogen regulatory protein P-II 1
MKKIEAIIRPSKLKAIQQGLKDVDIPCLTVLPASGTGLQKSFTKIYRGTEQSLTLQQRTMIMCVVSDENLDKCVNVILKFGSDGEVGDGKIFIYKVEDAIRMSTGVRGHEAIH